MAAATTRGVYRRVVVAAESMATIDRSVHRLVVLLLLACPPALLTTAAGGWWLARRSLRPISRLTSEAEHIRMERLTDRLPVPATGDEVARLAPPSTRCSPASRPASRTSADSSPTPRTSFGLRSLRCRAIANLVDNAIKLSPEGGTVTVTTGHHGADVRVSVVDEGPGIPADAREAVFDRFHRLDPSRTRASGGSGIGSRWSQRSGTPMAGEPGPGPVRAAGACFC